MCVCVCLYVCFRCNHNKASSKFALKEQKSKGLCGRANSFRIFCALKVNFRAHLFFSVNLFHCMNLWLLFTFGKINRSAQTDYCTVVQSASVLNIQWYGNRKIMLFSHRHSARHCSGSISSLKLLLSLLSCGSNSFKNSSNCPADILRYLQKRSWCCFSSLIKPWNCPYYCLLMMNLMMFVFRNIRTIIIIAWCWCHLFHVTFFSGEFSANCNAFSVHLRYTTSLDPKN